MPDRNPELATLAPPPIELLEPPERTEACAVTPEGQRADLACDVMAELLQKQIIAEVERQASDAIRAAQLFTLGLPTGEEFATASRRVVEQAIMHGREKSIGQPPALVAYLSFLKEKLPLIFSRGATHVAMNRKTIERDISYEEWLQTEGGRTYAAPTTSNHAPTLWHRMMDIWASK